MNFLLETINAPDATGEPVKTFETLPEAIEMAKEIFNTTEIFGVIVTTNDTEDREPIKFIDTRLHTN